jgi:Ca2+-binding RTX toxin-like protein
MATLFVTSLADSGTGTLRDTIAAAQPGDTIAFNLAPSSTITLTSGQINIPVGKNLIIDGAGAPDLTISGNNSSRIFAVNANVVTGTSVTVRNLTLSNAYTPERGGAIFTTDEATLTLEQVTFRNNVADQGGGAVFANWNSDVFVSNSRFENNRAIAGNDERGAGAIGFLSPGTLQVTNSDFIGNQGINGAAINSLNGKLTITNSRFLNNDTLAATFDAGNPNSDLRGYGGALYTDRASSTTETAGTIRISGSVFENNRGRAEGGAAYLFTAAGQDNVIIENSRFVSNSVSPLAGGNTGNGGALTIISNGFNRGVDISNTTFANNTATNQGGAVWLYDSPATLTNTTFSGNQTGGGPGDIFGQVGGGLAIYNAATNITNSTFADNNADWVGGAIVANSTAAVTLRNSLFSNNTADNQFQIQQQVAGDNFVDGGGNLQFPAKFTNFFNDYNVLPNITIADPQLGALQLINGALVRPLSAGSPAIDAGVATSVSTDQTGAPRSQDGDLNGSSIPDVGAVEFPGVALPEINLQDGTVSLVDGTTTPLNFGTVSVGTVLTRTFTVLNPGAAALNLTSLTLPTGFSLVGALPTSVAAGSNTNLTIQVDTSAVNNFAGSFSLSNTDSDENPFDFAIQATVRGVNNNPVVTVPLLDQTTTATQVFQYAIAPNTFTDADSDPLALNATLTGGGALPGWLTFNPANLTFSGTPAAGDTGIFSIDLTALDGFGGSSTDTFTLTINPAPILPILGTSESDVIMGTLNADIIFGLDGHDTLSGDTGDDEIWGGAGNDRLFGQDGNDTLNGESGTDQMFGGNGDDLLFGGIGNDFLYGGVGNDVLFGEAGTDILTGNAGSDIFVLASGTGADTIQDFRLGEDQIGLSAGLTLGQLSITQWAGQTWIRDTTTSELLARLQGVNAATLIAQSNTAFVSI